MTARSLPEWIWVATCDWPDEENHLITSDQVKANARLISAAPDLLDVAKLARETILSLKNSRWSEAEGSDEEWVSDIDAAIAKATGAPNTSEPQQ